MAAEQRPLVAGVLDDPAAIRAADPSGMYDRIAELAEHILPAWSAAQQVELPDRYRSCRNIIVLGMGGSAIGGDLVRGLLADQLPVPMLVNRDYTLPGFVGPDSLVIVSSYSGSTEETLAAAAAAQAKGACLLALTTGGEVAKLAQTHGWPLIQFAYEAQPRAAWHYGFFPLLHTLSRLGYAPNLNEAVRALVPRVRELASVWRIEVPDSENLAKQLARTLHGQIAVLYGAGHLSTVARRWKGQINENAKAWAFFEEMPEANHNAAVGYPNPALLNPSLTVVFLDAADLHPRTRLRYRVTKELLDRAGVQHRTVDVGGGTALEQVVGTLLLGDYVSFYLAVLNGVDPTPVTAIDYLKGQLAKQ